jgi:hypothetical protein
LAAPKPVVDFPSDLFPNDVFEPASLFADVLAAGGPTADVLQGRRVTVRYADKALNNGNTLYFPDGKTTATKAFKTMVKITVLFDEDGLEQKHNLILKAANADVVYGIGIYRFTLARNLQLGQKFAELLAKQ